MTHLVTDAWKDMTILCTLLIFPTPPSLASKLGRSYSSLQVLIRRYNLPELIHVISAGINHMSNAAVYNDTQIPITTLSGIHGPTIAEWVILTSLVTSRKYNTLREWRKWHAWDDAEGGKTLFHTVTDSVAQ